MPLKRASIINVKNQIFQKKKNMFLHKKGRALNLLPHPPLPKFSKTSSAELQNSN